MRKKGKCGEGDGERRAREREDVCGHNAKGKFPEQTFNTLPPQRRLRKVTKHTEIVGRGNRSAFIKLSAMSEAHGYYILLIFKKSLTLCLWISAAVRISCVVLSSLARKHLDLAAPLYDWTAQEEKRVKNSRGIHG